MPTLEFVVIFQHRVSSLTHHNFKTEKPRAPVGFEPGFFQYMTGADSHLDFSMSFFV